MQLTPPPFYLNLVKTPNFNEGEHVTGLDNSSSSTLITICFSYFYFVPNYNIFWIKQKSLTTINNHSGLAKCIALAIPCCLWKDHTVLCQQHPGLLGHLHVFVSKTHELWPFDQSQSPYPIEDSYLSLKHKNAILLATFDTFAVNNYFTFIWYFNNLTCSKTMIKFQPTSLDIHTSCFVKML